MNNAHLTAILLGMSSILAVPSCNRTEQTGPPTILLGNTMCNECGMIISDERFATSTIILSDRGRSPLIFDDFNCQLIFEHKTPDMEILYRWSRDYESLEWTPTKTGWFVKSSKIHSPMASGMAFFQLQSDAQELSKSIDGEIVDFETAWNHSE